MLNDKILSHSMNKSKLKFNFLKDSKQAGIWQYSAYLSPLPNQFKLSLNEGQTPEISLGEVILKREDTNPTGSLKDRGLAYLISWAYSQGQKKMTLSSSGNAAIAAAHYCQLANLSLTVFVSPKISSGKLAELKKTGVEIILSERAVSEAQKFAQQEGSFNLRPSLCEFGPEGYQTMAFEILENQGIVEDIFLPVSSGTALVGVARGFKKMGFLPRLHLCQSTAVCPLAAKFTSDFEREKVSLAQALVAKTTPLKEEVLNLVRSSGGTGWVISNQEIQIAQKELKEAGIFTSEEGALAYAAVAKARARGWSLGKSVCLLTGKKYD